MKQFFHQSTTLISWRFLAVLCAAAALIVFLAGCQTPHLKPSQALAQQQLRKGMTPAEVEALLGRPSRRSADTYRAHPLLGHDDTSEIWTYRERQDELSILFFKGRVLSFEARERWLWW